MNAFFFILLIGPLIFFHEFGHFIVAKLFKVKVLRFSLGFGPRMFSFTRNGTEYCVCWLPLGGYVKMLGQEPGEEISPEEQAGSFALKPLWQRFLIILAGPLANLMLPLAIYFAYYGLAPQFEERQSTVLGTVDQGRPAYKAGLRPGDQIVAIDGVPVRYFVEDLMRMIEDRANKPTSITVLRKGEELTFTVVPELAVKAGQIGEENIGQIGVTPNFLASQVGILDPDSPAAKAGIQTQDLITAINGQPVTRWLEVEDLLGKVSPGSEVSVTYVRGQRLPLPLLVADIALPATTVTLRAPDSPSAEAFGFFSSEMFVADVKPGSPAEKAGLLPGDHILGYLPKDTPTDEKGCTTQSIADEDRVTVWAFLHRDLTTNPGTSRTLGVRRFGIPCTLALTITPADQPVDPESGQSYPDEVAQLGMSNLHALDPNTDMVAVDNRLAFAAKEALYRTVHTTQEIATIFGRLVQGRVPMKSLGGPIMIYKVAGQAAEAGWDKFLWAMALISINLGILNLLPIPMLDGGHLIFFAVEAVRRRPVSLRFREIASFVGLSMILLLMLFAFKNDLERYWPW